MVNSTKAFQNVQVLAKFTKMSIIPLISPEMIHGFVSTELEAEFQEEPYQFLERLLNELIIAN